MPWHIEEQDGEYCVIKDADDTVEACHETKDAAEDQMAALYASEAERMGVFDWFAGKLRDTFGPFLDRAWSGDASNYDSTSAYCDAALIDVNAAAGRDEKAQSHCMLPVKSPGSDAINWEGIQAAAGGHGIQAVEKPSDVPQEDWDSAMKTAANKIISEYNAHDETAPDAVYEIAEKEPPEDRASSVGQIYQQIDAQLWDSEEHPYAWLHDLYIEDDQIFAIVSERGKLYQVPFELVEGSVTLGEWEQVEYDFSPTEERSKTTVFRDADTGRWRWVSRSCSSVLNRVGEIDSRDLFDSFIEHAEETGEYGYRTFYHQGENFKTGDIDFLARDGYVLITSGLYEEDNPLAEAEVAALQRNGEEWGESIQYRPLNEPEIVRVGDLEIPVFKKGVLREVSTLLEEDAAAWFTNTLAHKEVMRMTQKIKDALVKLFGGDEERATAFLDDVGRVNREVEEEGMIAREAEEAEEVEAAEGDENVEETNRETDVEDQEGGDPEAAPVLELDDEALRAIAEQFEPIITPLRERVEEIGQTVDELAQGVEDAQTRLAEADDSIKARLAELEKTEDEKRQEYLDDMPRRRKIKVTHRPRKVRGATDGHDEPQETSLEGEANRTLANMPSLGRGHVA